MDPRTSIVVIGASAGGIEALKTLFAALPEDLNAAFFVVVHVPAHTPSQLDKVLACCTRLPVVCARNGERIQRGHVYVPAADRHLMVDAGHVRLTRGPKECRVRPAVDVLFRSAAIAFGQRVIGVVLSGMLDDGTAGLWAVKDRGGAALTQDAAEAQYPSMPLSAQQHVAVDFSGSLVALGGEIARLTRRSGESKPARAASRVHTLENLIADQGNALQEGVMQLGPVSQYTCPDCHGVLVQIEEGKITRFRCHTGHAFSVKTLLAEVNESIDKGLWDTIRSVEERVMLLRQMAALSREHGLAVDATSCDRQADEAERHIKKLRDLVLDPRFFGHDEKD